MIPKIIHYVWVGGNPPTPLMKKCIKSWKKYLPEYEMMLWNEDNFDINSNQYVREAYRAKKYAFVADYIRLHALYEYGGIYMDTDQEVIKPLDKFLYHPFFACASKGLISCGLIGAQKGNQFTKELLDYYKDHSFIKKTEEYDYTVNCITIGNYAKKYGFKNINTYQELSNGCAIYTEDYFIPQQQKKFKYSLTHNTHSIHHFAYSWRPTPKSAFEKKEEFLIKLFGYEVTQFIIKTYGYYIKFIRKTPKIDTENQV